MADEQPTETAPDATGEEQAPVDSPAKEAPAEAAPNGEAPATEETAADPPPAEASAAEESPTASAVQAGGSEGSPPAEGEAEAAPADAPPAGEDVEAPAEPAPEGAEAPPPEGGEQLEEGAPKPTGEQTEGEASVEGAEPVFDQPPADREDSAKEAPAEGDAPAPEDGQGMARTEATEGGEVGEGEALREGSPIGEQYSREGSPQPGFDTDQIYSPAVPGTSDDAMRRSVVQEPEQELAPGKDGAAMGSSVVQEPEQELAPGKNGAGSLKEDDGEEEMEYVEVLEFDREQLIERYHQALAEREQQLQQNYQLQHKLAEHFRKKKSEETRQEVDKNITDSEQRYVKYMAQLDDLRSQDFEERETYKIQIEEMKERCQAKQGLVEDEQSKFMEFQKQVALNSLNSRSGKPIAAKDIDQYLAVEARKEAEVVNVRLENIKLKNKLKKKEQQLKSKEELAEGLHLIDFEQLKIENQTYNEKIEERNEDLLKLRKKITSTVQVLTHLKEKLQFVHAENQVLKSSLHEVEDDAAKKRDKLTRTKQARDHLRIDNHRLRHNCGLLGNEPLLRDFEERKDESTDLRDKLEQLKNQHSELTLCCNGVRKKIEQARLGRV